MELSMLKSINLFNTIDEANIYMMEQPSEIQKNISRHNGIDQTFRKLYLYNNQFCNVLYLFSNIIDCLSIVIKLNIINEY